jgi:hypothetical protein
MRRQFYWLPLRGLIFATFALGLSAALHADPLRIVKIEPTAMFPKVKAGEPLRQLARLSLENSGAETEVNVKIIKEAGKKQWPYDALISQDGTDFQLITLDNADKIRHWNAKWAYPRLICATMDMFFDAIAAQADPAKIKAFAKDGNNQWADQDSAAARVLAEARKQGEAIPTAEKFATLAAALAGGEYPWTDIYQAYHRLRPHAHRPPPEGVRSYHVSGRHGRSQRRLLLSRASRECLGPKGILFRGGADQHQG